MKENTAAIQGLREYVAMLANYSPKGEALAERGEVFAWSPRPENVERGEAKMCYGNSGQIALMGDFCPDELNGATYYEGYVYGGRIPIPIEHAWVVKDGRVIDVTLRQPGDDECGFCGGMGTRQECQTGDENWSPDGTYGEADPDCLECDGIGCEEVDCIFCQGTGQESDPADELADTIYFGVAVPADVLRRVVVSEGTWGVLDKPTYYELENAHV